MTAELATDVSSPARRLAPVLLDREEDLAALDMALAEAAEGAGRVLLIEGPAGIGKTVLLDELRRRAGALGMEMLSARSGELERDFGFGVIRQLFEARVIGAGVEERARLLADAARLAEPVFAAGARTEGGADVAYATLHGLYWLVVNLTEDAPLLLTIDDVQWADEPSLRFLLHLATRLPGMPVVIALTMRTGSETRRPELQTLLLEAQAPILRPQLLGDAAVTNMVRATLGPDAAEALCRACAQATGGNPFLLSELLGELRRKARSSADIDPERVRGLAPARIAASVLLRVGRLDREAPGLTRSVAVLGDQARLVTCAQLARLDLDRARELADALAELAVFEPGEPLRFVHPIIRTAIYEDIPATERSGLHAHAARLLDAQYADPGTVAVHLLACPPRGDPDVVSTLREAARRAAVGGAPDTAASLLRRALEEPPGERDRPEILFELGTAEHELGVRTARLHLREAGETASDPVIRARAFIALAWATFSDPALRRQDLTRYQDVAREVRSHDRELALQLEAARLGGLFFNPDLHPLFAAEAERFRDIPAKTAAECLLLSFVARKVLATGHNVAEAGDLAERAASHPALASQGGHPLWRTNVTLCLIAAERYDVAEQVLTRAIRHAERAGSPQWSSRALFLRGLTRHRRGDLRDAEADGRAAYDARRSTYAHAITTQLTPVIDSLADQGRVAEGETLLADNDMDGDFTPAVTAILPLLARGRLRAAGGDLAAARSDLEQALHWSRTQGPVAADHDARVALVPVLQALGDHHAARVMADAALEAATASGSARAIGGALRVSGLVRGGQEGLELLQRAADTLATSPARLWHAEALVDLGSALRRGGQRTDARPVLRDGMELAHHCGATPLADRAADELRAAGARPRRRSGTGADALTASERRVAELAAGGMSNKEIAQSLFVTLRTVEMHLSNTYIKLEIPSRQGLTAALDG